MTKKTTIYDIAKSLKITAATVSRALNDHYSISSTTKKLVKETAEKMNYRQNKLALALKSGKSNNVGVIVPRINSNFFGSVITGIEEELNSSGYQVIICQSFNDEVNEDNKIESLINSQIDAIFISTSTKNYDSFERILKKDIPLIFFDRKKNMENVSSVTLDNFSGGYIATKHLIEMGCKKIAHISTGNLEIEIFKQRLEGYKQALLDYNLEFYDNFFLTTENSLENGKIAAEKLLNLEIIPDGIFISNDYAALGVIKKLEEKNIKIPEDIAIIGFSNEPFTSYMELSMSTVDQFPLEMGRLTANIFLEQQKTKDNEIIKHKDIIIEPKLIIRQSSKRK